MQLHGQTYILDEQFSTAPTLPTGFSGNATFGSNSSVNNFGRNAPSLQFLTNGQSLTYGPWTGPADAVSFYHKTNSTGGSSLTVEQSADGISWSSVGTCTIITTSATWTGVLNSSSRYLRITLTLVGTSRPYIDDLRIRSAANACAGNFKLIRALINGNCAQCEDANEFVDFYTGSNPLNVAYFELVNPYVVPTGVIGGAYGGNGFSDNLNVNWVNGGAYSAFQLDYISNLNLLAGCDVFVPVPSDNIIPPNSRVIAMTGAVPDATYNLNDMCGLGTVYVLFATRNICPTSSGKYANAGCSTNCTRYIGIFNHLSGCTDVRTYIASPTATSSGALYVFEGPLVGYVGNISCLALTLPVGFISFSGEQTDDVVSLNWTVSQDEDVLSFEVQRSYDNVEFEVCRELQADAGTGAVSYQIRDIPATGLSKNCYYRIRMIKRNGTMVFSDVISISDGNFWSAHRKGQFELFIVAPESTDATLELYDMNGRCTVKMNLSLSKGANVVSDLNFPAGVSCCVLSRSREPVLRQLLVR
jgi:hypothetical protein